MGRSRKYASDAERQAACRAKKAKNIVTENLSQYVTINIVTEIMSRLEKLEGKVESLLTAKGTEYCDRELVTILAQPPEAQRLLNSNSEEIPSLNGAAIPAQPEEEKKEKDKDARAYIGGQNEYCDRKPVTICHNKPRYPTGDDDFDRIWAAWPARRRVDKKKTLRYFLVALKKIDRAVLIAKAMMVAESPKALEDDGQFIMEIWRWFRDERWEDQPERYAADKPKTNGKPEKKEPAFLGMPNLDLGD